KIMPWFAPTGTPPRILPSGPSTSISSTPIRKTVPSGFRSLPKASPTHASSARPISPSSTSTTSRTPHRWRTGPRESSDSNETQRCHSYCRRAGAVCVRRFTHRLDGAPASTDDSVAGDTRSYLRQLPAAPASDPRLAHRPPAGGPENLVRRASGDSPRFAIHGLSIGARPGIVRAHEDQTPERRLEFF